MSADLIDVEYAYQNAKFKRDMYMLQQALSTFESDSSHVASMCAGFANGQENGRAEGLRLAKKLEKQRALHLASAKEIIKLTQRQYKLATDIYGEEME